MLPDIGTGYWEKTPRTAWTTAEKVNLVKENMDKIRVYQAEAKPGCEVNQVFSAKVQQMQEQQRLAEAQGV